MKIKDWSERLIWSTLVVGVVRYAATFAASDAGEITGVASQILTVLLSLTGVGMGILDTVGGGLLFNGWSRVFPKSGQSWSLRFKVLTFCVFGLLFSGLYILVPFTMSRISQESVLETLGGRHSIWAWVWATMVNLIPYILIGGIFTGNKMVSSLETESSEKVSGKNSGKTPKVSEEPEDLSESSKKDSGKFPKDWRKLRPHLNETDLHNLANMTAEDVKTVAEKYGVEERTVSNWRARARAELGLVET